MCMLCVEITKEQMTPFEIAKAYREMIEPDSKHWIEVFTKIEEHSDVRKVAEAMSELRKQDKF